MTPMKWLAAVIGVIGLLALIAGIIYFTVPAHSLPSFLGPLPHAAVKAHRKRRGDAAIAVAVVLWVIAGILFYVDRRQSSPKSVDTENPTPAPTTPPEAG